MKKRVSFIGMSLVLLIIILLAGCAPAATTEPTEPTPETMNIGVACTITGPPAFLGGHMHNALMMAIEDRNAKGGVTIAGKKYLLNAVERDTKCDATVGKTVAEELIDVYKVKLIAGPFVMDAIAMQPMIEENKVITFFVLPFMPAMAGPEKMFSYFAVGALEQHIAAQFAFVQKFHPEAKTVVGMCSDSSYELAAEKALCTKYAPQYGTTWLGMETFPVTTMDFMPVIQRVLDLKPDVINTSQTVGTGSGTLILKQLREAGFKGPILMRSDLDEKSLLEVVGKESAEGCIDIGINPDSSLVPAAYKDLIQRYEKKYNTIAIDLVGPYYDATSAFFDFLNTQDTMDTTQWTEAFAKYKWTGAYGDTYWGGKPIYANNHVNIHPLYMSEWHDGKRDTKFAFIAPKDIAGE